MAGTSVSRRNTATPDSDFEELKASHNLLVADVENIRRQMSYMMPGVVLSAPASKTGTSAATAWRTEAFTFTFRGKITSAAAQEKAFTATTHDVAASKEAWYVLSLQTDGTSFTITKGADQTIGTVVLPTGPDNEIIVAYLGIVTNASGIFDASTADLAAGGNVTSVTFVDAPAMAAAGLTAYTVTDVF